MITPALQRVLFSAGAPIVVRHVFSASALLTSGSSAMPLTGALAGDLLVINSWAGSTVTETATLAGQGAVAKLGGSPSGSQTGPASDGAAKYGLRAVTLNPTDAAGTLAIATAGGVAIYQLAVWRVTQGGAPVAGLTPEVKDFQQTDNTATTINLAGWTPDPKMVLSLLFMIDRQSTASNPVADGWTRIANTAAFPQLMSTTLRFFQSHNNSYAGGAVSLSGFANGASPPNGYNTAFALEVTRP